LTLREASRKVGLIPDASALTQEAAGMKGLAMLCVSILCWASTLPCFAADSRKRQPIIFATFAQDANEIQNVCLLAESVRIFGGSFRDVPIWLYVPQALWDKVRQAQGRLTDLGVEVKASAAPEDAAWFYYSGKVFAAGRAEADAAGRGQMLAWLDEDTVFLDEPAEFILPVGIALGYRPVMHQNVGLPYGGPVDSFWRRVYDLLGVPDSAMFSMVTPADGDTIRPYFNAGCMVVRPERGLLAEWGHCFTTLYQDSMLTAMCREDNRKRIFIHQVALTGAILTHLKREEMKEFSNSINYPIFFEQQFEAKRTFDDITGVVTIRHESYFADPAPGWQARLKGPRERIAWMKEHLERKDAK
jgi:hypothetical protein